LTSDTAATIAAWSYGIAATAYLAFALRIVAGWRRSPKAQLLLLAALATTLWAAAACAVEILDLLDSSPLQLAAPATDLLRYGAWLGFVASLLAGRNGASDGRAILARPGFWLVVIALVASFVFSLGPPVWGGLGLHGPRAEFGLRIALAVAGLMLVERLFRRAEPDARWAIKPICIALAGIFGFELFFYADAMLFGRLDPDIRAAQGIVNAMIIPFIAIATVRNTGWTIEIHLSRRAVVQSTALIVSGAFLIAVSVAGYYVRYLGGDWGRALQIELVFAALLSFALVASSGRFRSKLRVFVSKHFFSYRYDYREEWQRFTRILAGDTPGQGIQERVIIALANLVESPAGLLWLATEAQAFQPAAKWNMPSVNAVEPATGSLAQFLERTGWIVSLDEVASDPGRYAGLTLPTWLVSMANAWLIAPLVSGTGLVGFVVLATPRTKISIDWEVRDLLKAASQQAASYLGQLRATEALLEARKFDAFNRMSAFVVHDLKNLVAQLTLMLRNAERHRDNQEFQRDMLATVQHVVERMNKLMLQLRLGTTPVESARPVDLGGIIRRVCEAKAGQGARIEMTATADMAALGNEERLEHVIAHLLQNALDASPAGGRVAVRLSSEGRFAVVEVDDSGVGMTPEFVRERLFKPFETTKPSGMGIGVYESTQYIATLGGQVLFDTKPNEGTQVRVLVPLADNEPASSALREVA
jgi:putative PEP-CTERM system histidine kinase